MKKRGPEAFVADIFKSIEAIERYVKDLPEEVFFKDQKTLDAVLRNFEIIGEAVKNLSDEFRKNFPNVPWKSIAGMRDIVIHEYFDLDNSIVWNAIKIHLPQLKIEIKKLLK